MESLELIWLGYCVHVTVRAKNSSSPESSKIYAAVFVIEIFIRSVTSLDRGVSGIVTAILCPLRDSSSIHDYILPTFSPSSDLMTQGLRSRIAWRPSVAIIT